MDASFEVAVPREYGGGDDVVGFDDVFDASVKWAGVSDAGGAAVADGLEAEFVELGLQAGLGEVIGHHTAAWAEAGFHGWLDGETEGVGFLGEQSSREHDTRVAGVGATGDGRDQDGAVGDGILDAGFGVNGDFEQGFAAVGRWLGDDADASTKGLGDGVAIGLSVEGFGKVQLARTVGEQGLAVAAAFDIGDKQLIEFALQRGDFDAVLRAFRAGDAGHHVAQVEFEFSGEVELAAGGDAIHALGFEVIFHRSALFLAAACAAQVSDGFVVDAEEAHGGTVFGGHVGDGGAVGDRQADSAGAEEFDELTDDTEFAQHLGDMQDEVGGGDAFFEGAGEVDADDFRHEEGDGLAEHASFCLNAAYAPTDDTETVDHGGVRVRADEGVGIKNAVFFEHAFGEIFEVHLVNDADAWGHDFEGVEGLLTPFEELVTLAVAGEFEVEVLIECGLRASEIDLHTVVNDKVNRNEWLDHLGVFAHGMNGGAHGGEIDEQWHAGEVLQHDAGDGEWDFVVAGGFGVPVGQVFDVSFGDLLAVQIAQKRLEHDADGNREA